MAAQLNVSTHYLPNGHGWDLELRRCYHPEKMRLGLRPLMIVPGYGMNAFIFSYHPTGTSMEAAFAEAGFEVWSVNLRAQGGSIRRGGDRRYDIENVVLEDLPAAIDGILGLTRCTGATKVDAIGASLGGTFLYAYIALAADPKIGSLVAMGAPLSWVDVNPLLKLAFTFPEILGKIPLRGTQRMARILLPLVVRAPFLLEAYLHPEIVDTTSLAELTRTVEDPNPLLNRRIAYWIRHQDLIIRNINVTTALADCANPLLCVVANGDGIVPRGTALSGYAAMGTPVKEILEVGDEAQAYAHADLFISNGADEKIFYPIARWLLKQESRAVA